MTARIQANRPLSVTTPQGKDALLLVGITGQEAISQPYCFQLDVLAANAQEVPFEKLLGQKIAASLSLPGGKKRFFHGICSRLSQGERDTDFTTYRIEIVPQFWLLTRKAQSRTFQHLSVPDILRKVLDGLDVTYELQGTFHARDFCVQYRETDFNFASRLMEEEGIYYFFKHTANGHSMVVANTPQSHPDLPEASTVPFEEVSGGTRTEDCIGSWEKTQELRSGKCTLRDHCFELPHQELKVEKSIQESVPMGKATHSLKVAGTERLEIYDWPGEYAQRFDGIHRGGGEQSAELQKIFQDSERTVAIRMQEEAAASLVVCGTSNCRQFVSGHKFTLERHPNAAGGPYMLTGVTHMARLDNYRAGDGGEFAYENRFTCIPLALPFRPRRTTPKPVVPGSQTAVVVGPPGEEIFTDKYGRVKVQFHWDREGQHNADSSCWVRVGTSWAGKQWGALHIPRVGQEVLLDFLEGDPDQPVIIGSVWNAEMMPPYPLPSEKTKSTIKTRSSPQGGPAHFSEIRFEDKKGKEQLFVNAERDLDLRVENDTREFIGRDRHLVVKANQVELVEADRHAHVKGNHLEKIDGDVSFQVGGKRNEKVGTVDAVEAGQEIHLKAGMKIILEAGAQISLVGPGGFIDIGPAGVTIQGTMVHINSGGSAGSGSGSNPKDPKDPDIADDGSKTGKLNG